LQDATTQAQDCRPCHTPGFGFNPYGDDLKEINIACTFPGDAISPAELDSWGYIKALFR